MLTLEAAFDRIGSAFRQMGYAPQDVTPPDESGNRQATYVRPNLAVRVCSYGRARLLSVQVRVDGEWVDFVKRGVGPEGLDEKSVEALVHKVRDEVDETSTDS
ncbi:MAG TPA: hypothetical protein VMN82_08665 [Thermoanaerobaculia bacterium]|nr:hypothetical protein [Thermoanaerobaculia bacterium]